MSFLYTYNVLSIQVATAHIENHLASSSHMNKKPLGKEYENKDKEDQLRSLNPNNHYEVSQSTHPRGQCGTGAGAAPTGQQLTYQRESVPRHWQVTATSL